MFGGGKHWRISGDSPNFINDVHYEESKQAGICQCCTHQKLNSDQKFAKVFSTKHLR